MKFYPSIFAYLNQKEVGEEVGVDHLFEAKDRPYLVLEPGDILSLCPILLINQTNQVYEIGFPWLKPTDLQHNDKQLETQLTLEINQHLSVLKIRDEVLDIATIEDDKQLEEFNGKLDDTVAKLLQIFTGLCENIFDQKFGTINTFECLSYRKSFKNSRLPRLLNL